MRDEKDISYTIRWSTKVVGWQPLVLPEVESVEPEITDLTEAQAVLAKIMTL